MGIFLKYFWSTDEPHDVFLEYVLCHVCLLCVASLFSFLKMLKRVLEEAGEDSEVREADTECHRSSRGHMGTSLFLTLPSNGLFFDEVLWKGNYVGFHYLYVSFFLYTIIKLNMFIFK